MRHRLFYDRRMFLLWVGCVTRQLYVRSKRPSNLQSIYNATKKQDALNCVTLCELSVERIIYDDGQYTYTFFPCEPDNLISAKGSCKNVALCKYDTTGSPHVYRDIGEQRDVKCEATSDYPFELKYTITSGAFKGGTSTVIIKCSKDPSAKLVPINITTTIMKFKLETPCGCPNQCLPESPTTAKPGPTPAPPK